MKNRNKIILTLVLLALGVTLFFYGLPVSKVAGIYDIRPLKDTLNYGLDLTGGVNVVLEADEASGEKITADTLDKAISTIRTRIDAMGVKEPTITKQGDKRIRVSIPDIEDQKEALDVIGKTAKLQFVGPDGKVVLDGSHVKNAKYENQKSNSSYGVEEPVVTLEFDDRGKELFAEATQKFINQTIEIKLDDEVISSPTVQSAITDGKAVITGSKDKEEAISLATMIKAGALPVKLNPVEVRTVGPTLGQDSLHKSVNAGIVGVALVLLFMIAFYKMPGVVAGFNLFIFILIYMIVMYLLGVTLTLPGIAGIILSIGMAVDANVIIFERLREELALGKSKMAAIDTSYAKAFSTIFDSNITTIIAGLVLYFLGSGTIKGFALTLMVGVLVSMFTAVFITKRILKMVVTTGKFEDLKYYGVRRQET